MRYVIEKGAGVPAYLQLYYAIRKDIVSGIYHANTKLPSKRTIAGETGLSTITVEHAYALLCDEGYAEARERSGYFVIFKADETYCSPIKNDIPYKPTADAGAESTLFSMSVLKKTMRNVLNEYGETILYRPPNKGCIELRQAVSEYLARSRGINADAEQIIIGSGSEYLYGLIVGLLGREKLYAIETPSYKKIEQVYAANNARTVRLPLGNDGIDSAALRACVAEVLHISPYRSYPSGVTATATKRHEYLNWANNCARYIIEDDFESEFSVSKKPEETVFSLSANDNIIYMNTFSKTISPALRVGYIVLPNHLMALFDERMGFYSCTVSTYIQIVLAELIARGDFERHINRVRRKKRKELISQKRGV